MYNIDCIKTLKVPLEAFRGVAASNHMKDNIKFYLNGLIIKQEISMLSNGYIIRGYWHGIMIVLK